MWPNPWQLRKHRAWWLAIIYTLYFQQEFRITFFKKKKKRITLLKLFLVLWSDITLTFNSWGTKEDIFLEVSLWVLHIHVQNKLRKISNFPLSHGQILPLLFIIADYGGLLISMADEHTSWIMNDSAIKNMQILFFISIFGHINFNFLNPLFQLELLMMLRQLSKSTRLPIVHSAETPIFSEMSNYFCNFHISVPYSSTEFVYLSSILGVYT